MADLLAMLGYELHDAITALVAYMAGRRLPSEKPATPAHTMRLVRQYSHTQGVSSKIGRNDPCDCGSGLKYKRCCLDKEPSDVASPLDLGELTLIVDTATGPLIRRIANASPLPSATRHGEAAEIATHDAAAVWGLPDFICRTGIAVRGSGTREVSDGLLLAGRLGVVIQVKSREVPSDDESRERSWIAKKATEALKQGNGSIRQLQLDSAEVTNLRSRTLSVDGTNRSWLICVVMDHPNPPTDVVPSLDAAKHPAVVLLRRDWEFLFGHLKSTHAVVSYLERVADEERPLGEEPARYYDCAIADANADPDAVDPAFLRPGAKTVSGASLPMVPVNDEPGPHGLLRVILEDIATAPIDPTQESMRVDVLAELDRLQLSHRAELGRFLLESFQEVSIENTKQTVWKLRWVTGGRRPLHLGFGVCNQFSEQHQARFSQWIQLRHYELRQATGAEFMTVGVLLTPRRDGTRPWDTSMSAVAGPIDFDEEDLQEAQEFWKVTPE